MQRQRTSEEQHSPHVLEARLHARLVTVYSIHNHAAHHWHIALVDLRKVWQPRVEGWQGAWSLVRFRNSVVDMQRQTAQLRERLCCLQRAQIRTDEDRVNTLRHQVRSKPPRLRVAQCRERRIAW